MCFLVASHSIPMKAIPLCIKCTGVLFGSYHDIPYGFHASPCVFLSLFLGGSLFLWIWKECIRTPRSHICSTTERVWACARVFVCSNRRAVLDLLIFGLPVRTGLTLKEPERVLQRWKEDSCCRAVCHVMGHTWACCLYTLAKQAH